MMEMVNQNLSRLQHLLALFKLNKDEFLSILNEDSTSKINEEDVFSSFIKVSTLNKVDKIFNKGLAYYANPYSPTNSKDESIFFRKDNFNSTLNLRSKQVVNRFEEEKLNFDTLTKLSDIEVNRTLPLFTVSDNPVKCAKAIRELIYPSEKSDNKRFLKNLISALAQKNVLVFEFVEGFNRKNPANIAGFYLAPNVIVLKWQKYTRREIFTLSHEIGHYLLAEEDIDEKANSETLSESTNDVEKWCNDFAFSFLAGDYLNTLNSITQASHLNDYHNDLIEEISASTHLSTLAIYTHLFHKNKISDANYKKVSNNINAAWRKSDENDARLRELKKQEDILAGKKPGGGTVKALLSPLYIQALQSALYNGFVDEYEFCRKLKIPQNKIEDYLV